MFFSLSVFSASAANEKASSEQSSTQEEKNKERYSEIISSFNNPNGRLMSVAHKGNWRNYPENSLEGIQSCIDIGVDIVEVDIQKTKDSQFVLMSDSDLSRMCVDKDGHTIKSKVSDKNIKDIQEYYLRDSRGGVNSKETKYKVPSLEDAIKLCKGNIMIMIDNAWKYGDEIQSIVKRLDAEDLVILRKAGTPEEISKYIQKNELPISHICGYYEGVMASPAKKYVKETLTAGSKIIELSSKNGYSSLFKKSVLKKFEGNGRAFISTVDTQTCGDREDMEKDWDDLVDRGYSVIETDFPQELVSHIKDIEADKAKLSSLITQAQGLNTTNYSKDSGKGLKKSLSTAEDLSSDGSISLYTIDEARYKLQKSIDNMAPRTEKDKDGLSTGAIVALIVLAIVLLIGVLYVLRRSKNKVDKTPDFLNPDTQNKQPQPKKKKKLVRKKKVVRRPHKQSSIGDNNRPTQQPPMSDNGRTTHQQPPMGDNGRTTHQQPPMGDNGRPTHQQPPMGDSNRKTQQPPMSDKDNNDKNQPNE